MNGVGICGFEQLELRRANSGYSTLKSRKDISNNDNWIITIWRLHNAINMRLKTYSMDDKNK